MIALTIAAARVASAQLAAPQQPTERLLILPFQAAPADSAASIALADAVRDRVTALTKSKVMVVPKAKLCEALKASGFPCDGLLDDQQARQLARFLQVHAYATGDYQKQGTTPVATVRMIDISSSGMAATFTASSGNPGTTTALAETIAQKLAGVVRASEPVRDCNDDRKKGQFARARSVSQKVLSVDPNSVGAHLCLATVWEAQRQPDSVLVESQRALKGDSLNGTALENIARYYQQKNDTVNMINAFIQQLKGSPRDVQKRLGIAQLLRQMKRDSAAVRLLDEGLKVTPGESQLLDLKLTICNEAGMYRCSDAVFVEKAEHDTASLADSGFIKAAIGAAQAVTPPDTQALDKFTAAAVRHFPNNISFIKARAAALELKGQADSALVYYRKALAAEPNDLSTSLLIGKAIIDRATWDTTRAKELQARKDTVALKQMQLQFAERLDSAWTYLNPALNSSDSMMKLNAAAIMRTAGEKLVRAGAGELALKWLDRTLQITGFGSSGSRDTTGIKAAIRSNASFWYGLASVPTLGRDFSVMAKSKNCEQAKLFNDKLERTRTALQTGRSVHPPTVDNLLTNVLPKFDEPMKSVRRAFKCKNF
jgi:Tfp pilus assembly protein PilF